MRGSRILGGAAIAALLLLAGCGRTGGTPGGSGDGARPSRSADAPAASASNPLIGKWLMVSGNPGGCFSPIIFTETTQTLVMNGEPHDTPVTYNVSPGRVYVIGDTGLSGAIPYNVTGPDKMQDDSASNPCVYRRAG